MIHLDVQPDGIREATVSCDLCGLTVAFAPLVPWLPSDATNARDGARTSADGVGWWTGHVEGIDIEFCPACDRLTEEGSS